MSIRVAQIAVAAQRGGAARAMVRLHEALSLSHVDSCIVAPDAPLRESCAGGAMTRARRLYGASWSSVDARISKRRDVAIAGGLSLGWQGTLTAERINRGGRLPHLHLVSNGGLGLWQIARLNYRPIWTLHDLWPLDGLSHYPTPYGYSPAGLLERSLGQVTRMGRDRLLAQGVTFVAPSRWMAQMANERLEEWPLSRVVVIPNALNTSLYRLRPEATTKNRWGLNSDDPVIGFVSGGHLLDPRKGFDLLLESLKTLSRTSRRVQILVLGTAPGIERGGPIESVTFTGRLTRDQDVADAYSAMDVCAVPSRQDNLPQAATEAQACGVPVVAYSIGGLSDTVVHMQTGCLVTPYDTGLFADALQFVLEGGLGPNVSATAAARAAELWSYGVVAEQHRELYAAHANEAWAKYDN